MTDDTFPHIGTLLGVSECTVACTFQKIDVMNVRNNSVVTSSPPILDDFTRGNFFTSNKF